MLAVILVIVVGTIRLIGSNANTVFSQAASWINSVVSRLCLYGQVCDKRRLLLCL